MNSLQRLKEEYRKIIKYPVANAGMTVGLFEENNYYRWRFTLIGAEDSIYCGGLFYLEITFPNDYPETSPKIRFLTPIYHLNVNSSSNACGIGAIRPNFINSWNPSSSIREILIKLYTIFYNQNPDSPFDINKAKEYEENKSLFELKAKYFTKKYANGLQKQLNGDKDWDFFYDINDINYKPKNPKKEENIIYNEYDNNEFITLFFDFNDEKTEIKCQLKELTRDVIERFFNKTQTNKDTKKLFIFNCKRIELDIPIGYNGISKSSEILVIDTSDIIFL